MISEEQQGNLVIGNRQIAMLLNGESKYNGIFTSLYLVREKL